MPRPALLLLALVALLVSAGRAGAGEPVEVVALAGGGAHTCAITSEAGLLCWGANDAGQLGDETADLCGGVPCSTIPRAVVPLAGDVVDVAAGGRHTCAITTSDAVRCWGSNAAGQLGAAAADSCGTAPFEFACSTTPLAVQGLAGEAVAIGAGDFHTCALLADGGVRCWGENENGQLGDGTTADRAAPVAVAGLGPAVAIAVGGFHTCAITEDGTVWCWGKGEEGQLGGDYECGQVCPTPLAVAGLDGIVELAAAGLHTCARTAAGAVLCWGFNFDGQVGDGSEENVRTEPTPVTGLGTGVVAIDGGGAFTGHTCAITAASGLVCWGDNDHGQLGDGTMSDGLVPVAVTGLGSGVEAVAAGHRHTCAIAAAGVLCWGLNSSGQVGDGTTDTMTAPAGVVGLSGSAPGDVNCDGSVTSVDAALILQFTAALFENLACPDGADANGDGAVNSVDAALVLQFVAGLIEGL